MPRCSMPAAVEAEQLRSCGSRAAEDGAAPEDFAVVEGCGLLQGPGHDAPAEREVQTFTYEYFQRIRVELRNKTSAPGAIATPIKHVAAIHWLNGMMQIRCRSIPRFDVTMALDPNGVQVPTYVKHDENGIYFDEDSTTLWCWPELIASADDCSLLVHGGQHVHTALQYIVNGPTWLENRLHRTGITACWIHSNTSLRLQREDGSCVILEMSWENGQIRMHELEEIDAYRCCNTTLW